MRRRAYLAWTVSTFVAGGTAAIVACGSFGGSSEDGQPATEGGPDTALPVDGASFDGPAAETGNPDGAVGTVGPLCPPPPGPTCMLGACTLRTLYVPDAKAHPFDMVTDSAYVYWLEQRDADVVAAYNGDSPARVMRVDRMGSSDASRATVLVDAQDKATTIALVPPYLYWATWVGASSTSTLHRVKTTCAAPCQPEPVGSYSQRIVKMVGVGTEAVVAIAYDGTVLRYPVTADGSVTSHTVVMTSSKLPGLGVTSTNVYASGLLVNKIARSDVTGVSVSPSWVTLDLDAGDGGDLGLTKLATNCTELFGVHSGGAVERIDLASGTVTHLADLNRAVYGTTADAKYVYFATLNGGGVVAVDHGTGLVTVVDMVSAWAVATDDVGVYWGDHPGMGNGGTIRMLVK